MSAAVMSPAVTVRPRARRAGGWTAVGLILAVALIVSVAGSFIGSIAYEPITPSHRVFESPIRAIQIDIENGSVTIEPDAGGDAVVESSGVNGLSSPSDVERVSGGTLVVRSSCATKFFENHCTRNYVLRVPPDVRVDTDTDSGDVTARDLTGALTLRSGQGDVTVEGATGSVQLSSGQGDVTATGLTGATAVAFSGQGEVRLGFLAAPRVVNASSGQGDVSIVLPRGPVAYQVHAASSQGLVMDKVAVNPTSRQTVRATSGQGDVSVSYGNQ
jgi:hypothetical protein